MLGHITFLLFSLWTPGEYWNKFWGTADDVSSVYDKLTSFEKGLVGVMDTIRRETLSMGNFVENINSSISNVEGKINTYLPKLGDISTYSQQMKTALGTVDTNLTGIHSTLNEAKNKIVSMAGDIEDIPGMATDMSIVKSGITNVKTYLSDIKTKIADNLPNLSKLTKLDVLDDIKAKLETMESSIKSLDFGDLDLSGIELTIPEDLQLSIDDTKIVNQLKELTDKFSSLDLKLNTLENISGALQKQNYMIDFGVKQFTQNLKLTEDFFATFARLDKLNTLGLKILKLEVSPLDFYDKFNEILESGFSFQMADYSPPEFIPSPGPGVEPFEPFDPGHIIPPGPGPYVPPGPGPGPFVPGPGPVVIPGVPVYPDISDPMIVIGDDEYPLVGPGGEAPSEEEPEPGPGTGPDIIIPTPGPILVSDPQIPGIATHPVYNSNLIQ